ncbi:DUF1349 domain-containing protein [Paenibacillus luteus]|uniref:DUF1349 domain-containing protein n=1 Tax=Paenibacillus luteus TaxID=2545753 RepID=UPI00114149CD|nr:DUF1349 domain-containing protein [Paenibacillus luteus]
MDLFINCLDQSLSSELKWMNDPKEWSFDDNQALTVSAPAMADFFRDPAGVSIKASAPFLYTTINGDFSVETRVSVDMLKQYDSGCLMIMADELNWAKLCFEFFDNKPSILSVVTQNNSDDCVSGEAATLHPYLRIARSGKCFAFHYSIDGEQWKMVRYFGMDAPQELKVGVVAQSPIGEGCKVKFENLLVTPGLIGDVRDVTK